MQGTYMLDVSKNVLHTYLWYALKFSILEQPQYKQWYHSYFLNPVIYAYRGRNDYKIDYCEYFDEMKVFFSGENLYTWDHLPEGLETDMLTKGAWEYPFMRKFSFGINVTF